MADDKTLLNAIIQIQAAFRKYVGGLKQVPEMPPEDASVFPFAVSFPSTGNQNWKMAGVRKDLHNIQIELHIMRKDLDLDISQATSYIEAFPEALKTAERAGELSAMENFGLMEYTFGVMGWSEVPTVGITWILHDVWIEVIIA